MQMVISRKVIKVAHYPLLRTVMVLGSNPKDTMCALFQNWNFYLTMNSEFNESWKYTKEAVWLAPMCLYWPYLNHLLQYYIPCPSSLLLFVWATRKQEMSYILFHIECSMHHNQSSLCSNRFIRARGRKR